MKVLLASIDKKTIKEYKKRLKKEGYEVITMYDMDMDPIATELDHSDLINTIERVKEYIYDYKIPVVAIHKNKRTIETIIVGDKYNQDFCVFETDKQNAELREEQIEFIKNKLGTDKFKDVELKRGARQNCKTKKGAKSYGK